MTCTLVEGVVVSRLPGKGYVSLNSGILLRLTYFNVGGGVESIDIDAIKGLTW